MKPSDEAFVFRGEGELELLGRVVSRRDSIQSFLKDGMRLA